MNSMLAAVWPFFEYCFEHQWCGQFKRLKKIKTDDPMKGRPITGEEFDRMLGATPLVVGKGVAESWLFAFKVLWESAFRIGDLMEFSWDDERYIHPVWPTKPGQHPTIVIPSAQKNGKWEEIPMLPGLAKLLRQVPKEQRTGWVVDPSPIEFVTKSQTNWFMPSTEKLAGLIPYYSNTAIAKACGVSDRTVGVWLRKLELARTGPVRNYGAEIPETLVRQLRATAARENAKIIRRSKRLTADHVGKIISAIGEQAGIVVKAPRKGESGKVKYASAHDLRRGVAQRLINSGVSAETLTVVMRHDDFSTTQAYYGAKKQAQSAAAEINEKLATRPTNSELVGRLVGRFSDLGEITPQELRELKSLLERV